MAERIEIIFEAADRRPGEIMFDVQQRGHRYIDHDRAGTAERSKIAADIYKTADRKGFRFLTGVQKFASISPEAAADPRMIVDAFRDQGYDVQARGYYMGGKVLTHDEISSMSVRDRAMAIRDEAVHVETRNRQRTEAEAAAINRLREAAQREEMADMTRVLTQPEREAIRARQAEDRRMMDAIDEHEEAQNFRMAS